MTRHRLDIQQSDPAFPSGFVPRRHAIVRTRHDARRRRLTLIAIERVTPRMLRLVFSSPDLRHFVSAAPDDHIKLFFPIAGADAAGKPCMRDFTPRRFDTAAGIMAIDFALHEAGPATLWAATARVGDTLEIGGPRGSAVVPDDFDWYLLIGDETALPAIGRRVEELRPDVPVATFVLGEAQHFPTRAAWRPHWIARGESPNEAALLRAALAGHELPPGEGFVWIAAEAAVARDVRRYVVEARHHPREWTKAAGYWTRGQAGIHERIED